MIGQAQANGAKAVMNGPRTPVSGSVRSVHQFVDMYVKVVLCVCFELNVGLQVRLLVYSCERVPGHHMPRSYGYE